MFLQRFIQFILLIPLIRGTVPVRLLLRRRLPAAAAAAAAAVVVATASNRAPTHATIHPNPLPDKEVRWKIAMTGVEQKVVNGRTMVNATTRIQ